MFAELALTVTTTSTAVTAGYAWQLFHRLRTDPLTGLANRTALHAALRRAGRRHPRVAVAVGDMNGFKALNDTHGHRFGDQVLIAVADALRTTAGRGELPVRLHGDEFAVLIPAATDRAITERLDDYRRAVAAITEVNGQPVEVGMALGAMSTTARAADLSRLLASADDRMYGDKHTRTTRTPAPVAS